MLDSLLFMNSAVERKILEMKLPDFLTRTSRMIVIIIKKKTNDFHRGNPSTLDYLAHASAWAWCEPRRML